MSTWTKTFFDDPFFVHEFKKGCENFKKNVFVRAKICEKIAIAGASQCNFMILRYLLSSLFSQQVPPTQAESILPALGKPVVKRERTTNNVKS